MPFAAPKPCMVCSTLVTDGSERCGAHKREVWKKYADAPKRVTGRRLQAQRAALFAREPLCRECARQGLTTLATIRDHIAPLAEGGLDVDANVQPLCQPCSDAKTATESARGRAGQPQGRGVSIPAAPGPETERFAGFSRAQVLGIFS